MADALSTASTTAPVTSPWERRLAAEWSLLRQLAHRNPGRLTNISSDDATFRFRLQATPAISLRSDTAITEHAVRVEYPRFFPAVALELYLDEPVLHPNVHPETGFVCLWDAHRSSNTIEHALHKTVAILSLRLVNLDPRHVMQPEAAPPADLQLAVQLLPYAPLLGLMHDGALFSMPPATRRRRLS